MKFLIQNKLFFWSMVILFSLLSPLLIADLWWTAWMDFGLPGAIDFPFSREGLDGEYSYDAMHSNMLAQSCLGVPLLLLLVFGLTKFK